MRVLGEGVKREISEGNLVAVSACLTLDIKEMVHLQASLLPPYPQSCREQMGQRDK